jgi:hypothetical protein
VREQAVSDLDSVNGSEGASRGSIRLPYELQEIEDHGLLREDKHGADDGPPPDAHPLPRRPAR